MNQDTLIRLEKAAEKMVLQIPASLDSDEFTSLFNEKFAELIVAECVSIAQSADDDSWKLDGKGTEIARNIQQHFGVER